MRFALGWEYRCRVPKQPAWLTDRVHKPLLDWTQNHIQHWKNQRHKGIQERLKILIWTFRGSGKSNLITKGIPLWVMLDEPDATFYIGSETHTKAKEFLAPMKAIISGEDPFALFTWFYGNWYDPGRMWSQDAIVTGYRKSQGVTEPSLGTFGTETGITGKHPLGIMFDDPLTAEKIKEGEKAIRQAVDSVDSINFALRGDGLICIETTRYAEEDVVGNVLARDGIASWSGHPPIDRAHFDRGGTWHVYFLQARDVADTKLYAKGRPVLPEAGQHDAFLEDLERRRPQYYATQMMGDAAKGDHMELTVEQCEKLMVRREDIPPIEYATIHLDTAFKMDNRRERGDRSVIVVWLHDLRPTGMVYLDRVVCSAQWRSEDFDSQLVRVLHDLKYRGIRVRAITDEMEMGGKRGIYLSHLQTLISGAGLRIPEIMQLNRGGKAKVVRIREALGFWVEGFVRIASDCPNANLLIAEITRLGRAAHDDIADAAADVFLPNIWRGRHLALGDVQPHVPRQPGDDVLKVQSELDEIARKLRRDEPMDDLDPQPFESMLRSGPNRLVSTVDEGPAWPLDRTRGL